MDERLWDFWTGMLNFSTYAGLFNVDSTDATTHTKIVKKIIKNNTNLGVIGLKPYDEYVTIYVIWEKI